MTAPNPARAAAMVVLASRLADYDRETAKCPYRQKRCPPSDDLCKLCGASSNEGCGKEHYRATRFVEEVRQLLLEEAERASGEVG